MFFNHKKYIGSYLGTDASSASYIPDNSSNKDGILSPLSDILNKAEQAGTGAGKHDYYKYASKSVNIRLEPNKSSDIVGVLNIGDQISVSDKNKRTDLSEDWTQVIYQNKPAYIDSASLSMNKSFKAAGVGVPDADYALHATQACNVRAAPSTSSDKLGTLKSGDSVIVSTLDSRSNLSQDWTQIIYNGQEAYVWSDYLANSSQKPATVQKTAIKAIPKPVDPEIKKAQAALESAGLSTGTKIGIAIGASALLITGLALWASSGKEKQHEEQAA